MMKRLPFAFIALLAVILIPLQDVRAMTNKPTDLVPSSRVYEEVMYLSEGQFLSSDDANKFLPDAPMTRAHAAMMIGAALELNGKPRWTKFSDVPSSNRASGYIQSAVDAGVISGYADGTFKPNNTLNRGEMAMLFSRLDGNSISNADRAGKYLMNQGIALGVTPSDFGSKQLMKRGDFAVFLTRTINPTFRLEGVTLAPETMYVKEGTRPALNVRKGPSTKYAVVTTAPAGKRLSVFKKNGQWSFVEVDGKYGFVHSSYLTKTEQSVTESDEEPVVPEQPTPPAPQPPAPEQTKPVPPATNNADLAYLATRLVALDPGHGGKDPGAVGYGYAEKTATLAIAKYANEYFKQSPIQTMMTRTDDRFLELWEIGAMANARNASLFVSIHINSAASSSATGLESYSMKASSAGLERARMLSKYMQNRMVEAWPLPNRGVKTANFQVLRDTKMPAVLLEMGFINNKRDNYYIRTASEQKKMGRAVYLGTLDYYYHYEGRKGITSLYDAVGAKPSKRLY